MSGTMLTGEGLDARRRRLLYRSWHRGTREMDLLMGRFADVHLPILSDDEIDAFEQLIDIEDPDLFHWINTGVAPEPYDTPMFQRFRTFHLSGEGLPEI